ncbi:MAG: NADH-quinone oxidoreductase subunit L [Bdellovibrionota bacterium]
MEKMILLAVFLPFLSSALIGLWQLVCKEKAQNVAGYIACASILVSFVCFAMLSNEVWSSMSTLRFELGSWISLGDFSVPAALSFDKLSATLALVVSGIGFLIHVYSLGYMSHDENRAKYFSYLNLFCGFMLVLIQASSLPLLFVGWEGVGVCSFLLIGFWYTDKEKAFAGRKAFIVNRIGDAALIVGMALLYWVAKTLDFSVLQQADTITSLTQLSSPLLLECIGILIFVGCMGKSAQFPLYVWLPDAMAGPTPVSALIHAATMVTAGVYVLARMSGFYVEFAPHALSLVAFVGATTAFFAATIAVFQKDIKKVLAFSTVSQLGYMMLAMGVGAFSVGVFHLVTHAYFKALLFLGSGSVIHALSGEQNIHNMGGLKTYIVGTTVLFFIGFGAIIGFPLMSGWFSKDLILHSLLETGHPMYFIVALISAFLTTIYMTRLCTVVFLGTPRRSPDQLRTIHESPKVMLVPMGVLALLSIVGGMPFLSVEHSLANFFPTLEVEHGIHVNEHLLGWSVTFVVLILVGLSIKVFSKKRIMAQSGLASFFAQEYYINRVSVGLGSVLMRVGSSVSQWFDVDIVDRIVNFVGRELTLLSKMQSKNRSGKPQTYAAMIVFGLLILLFCVAGV